MSETERWKDYPAISWRNTLGTSDTDAEMDQIDKKVREQGPESISYLKLVAEDRKKFQEARYRSMIWLVSLYLRYPEVNKFDIIHIFKKVVESELEAQRSQPRDDALRALVELKTKPLEGTDKDALNYLLELISNDKLNKAARNDVFLAIAETNSPLAIKSLVQGILEGENRQFRIRLVDGIQNVRNIEWKVKADAFFDFFKNYHITSSQVDANAVVQSLISVWENDPIRLYTKIGDYIIENSRNRESRIAAIMAKLLIEAVGGDQIQAGHRINEYEKHHELLDNELKGLREAVGGAPALEGIRKALRNDLEKYFQVPIFNLNTNTMASWEKTIKSARIGLALRLWMSGLVFALGVLLLLASSYSLLFLNNNDALNISTVLPFLSGLGIMLLIIYKGPLNEIRQAVIDLSTANAAFIAYAHRVLETSHTYSFYYRHDAINFERTQKSSEIIKNAMLDTIEAFEREAKNSAEKPIGQAFDELKNMITIHEKESKKKSEE